MRCSPNRCCHRVLWFRFLRRAFIHTGRLSLVWQRVTIRLMTRQRWEKSSSSGGNVQRACMRSGSNTQASITNGMGRTKRSDRFPQGRAHTDIGEKGLVPIGVDGEEIGCHPAHGRDGNQAWRNHTANEWRGHGSYTCSSHAIGVVRVRWMLLPASVDDNVVACHSAEHPCGTSALRGLFRTLRSRLRQWFE